MGNTVIRAFPCFFSSSSLHPLQNLHHHRDRVAAMNSPLSEPLDEGLGHSFCYIRPQYLHPQNDSPFSPSQSDRFTSISFITDPEPHSSSFRSSVSASASAIDNKDKDKDKDRELSLGAFKSISGASVSANTSTPCTIVSHQQSHPFANVPDDRHAAFESSSSFASLPLQPVPKGVPISAASLDSEQQQQRCFISGPIERSLLMSGPLERGFMSGPLERGFMSGPIENLDSVDGNHYSAPLAGFYMQPSSRKRQRVSHFLDSLSKPVKEALHSTVLRTRRSIVAPVRRLVWGNRQNEAKEEAFDSFSADFKYVEGSSEEGHHLAKNNLEWAQGKAGEDRVHVVVSEDNGWLYVGIYDGFNGPDAPDFLMKKLYRAVYKELRGLLWDVGGTATAAPAPAPVATDTSTSTNTNSSTSTSTSSSSSCSQDGFKNGDLSLKDPEQPAITSKNVLLTRNLTLKEFLALDSDTEFHHTNPHPINPPPLLSGSFDMSAPVPDMDSQKPGFFDRKTFFVSNTNDPAAQTTHPQKDDTKLWRSGAVDHNAVLQALGRALETTEEAYLALSDLALEENPELALMGSCILVALMKDKDVYVLNVGDSRAIVAQESPLPSSSSSSVIPEPMKKGGGGRNRQDLERISEESPVTTGVSRVASSMDHFLHNSSLIAVQLSTDHSTSIEEEVCRIRAEHPDDPMCIFNDRVKGRLKVTRAFGAGFLKKPRWNSAILKMFQIEYVGSAAYISCKPALHHHRLGPNDRFLILSSDGLYQYFGNQEVVSYVEWFMDKFPEGDPAQSLIEELLFRAAKKAGLDFHELLDIPQGDRRKYHDDVSVMVIAIDGRIWRSSG